MINTFNGHQFLLSYDKVLVHIDSNTGFIADLHLGKAAHFRKAGIAIPTTIIKEDLSKLAHIIKKHALTHLYFLGDLFHSDINYEWETFLKFLENQPQLKFTLIKGNHDILAETVYDTPILEVVQEPYKWKDFILSHHPIKKESLALTPELFNLAGHIHPGILLKGKARAAIKLPCFLERQQQLILPAFGRFTGLATDRSKQNINQYLIGPETVFTIP